MTRPSVRARLVAAGLPRKLAIDPQFTLANLRTIARAVRAGGFAKLDSGHVESLPSAWMTREIKITERGRPEALSLH